MKEQVERTRKLSIKADKDDTASRGTAFEKITIERSDDKELAQTLEQIRILQEQLDLAKNKYDKVHTKLDESDELAKNNGEQLDALQAVLNDHSKQ